MTAKQVYAVAWMLLFLGLLGWLWTAEWRWAASGVLAMLCCGVVGGAVSRKPQSGQTHK